MQYKKYVNATEVLSLAVWQFSLLFLATQKIHIHLPSIKSCNAKRRRQRKQPKTISRSSQQNNNFAHAAHFFYISSPLFCTTTTRNFQKLPRYTFYTLLFTFFVVAADFHLGGRQPLLFLTAAIKFSCFFPNEIGLLCFLSLAPALSLLSMSMQTLRLSGKKESDLLLLFLSLNFWEAMRFNAKTRCA